MNELRNSKSDDQLEELLMLEIAIYFGLKA